LCCVQVNKRGKVASRPGPGSKSFDEAQQLLAQQQQGMSPAEVTAQLEQKQQPQPPAAAAAAAPQQQQGGRQAITETPQVCYSFMLCLCRSCHCLSIQDAL
jgi:preprotein translocase subunit SecD